MQRAACHKLNTGDQRPVNESYIIAIAYHLYSFLWDVKLPELIPKAPWVYFPTFT